MLKWNTVVEKLKRLRCCTDNFFSGRPLFSPTRSSRRKAIQCFLVSFLVSLISFCSFQVAAGSLEAPMMVMPDNQYEDHPYFDLKLAPKQQQVLKVKLTNSAGNPIHVDVRIDKTITNDNGQLTLVSPAGVKKDSTLKFSMADLVKYDKEVEIPANSSIDYTFTLTAPAKKFKGMIAGGISFQEKDTPVAEESGEKKVAIDQKMAFALQIILRGDPDRVTSKLKLTKVLAKIGENNEEILKGSLHNVTPNFLTKMSSNVKIYAKSDTKRKKSLYEKEASNLKMAPNSSFNYSLSIEDVKGEKKLTSGDYVWVQEVNSAQGSWKFEKGFSIPMSKEEKLQKKAEDEKQYIEEVKKRQKFKEYLYLAILVVIIVAIVVVFFLGVKQYRKQKEEMKRLK